MKPSPIRRRALPALLLCLGLAACGGGGTPTDTQKPSVSLSATPATLTANGNVTLSATASDNVGVTKVEFYEGSSKIGEATSSPYSMTVSMTAAQNGPHSYTAKAFDAAGNSETSSVATVTVNIPTALPAGFWNTSNWDQALFQ